MGEENHSDNMGEENDTIGEEETDVDIPTKSRSLRARSVQKRLQTELNKDVPKKRDPRNKSANMSKYRRKTANAKERDRMKQVNDAFERLRHVIPNQKVLLDEDKSTKVTTLRCAITYINSLQQLIDDCVAGNIEPQDFNDDDDEVSELPKASNNKQTKSKPRKNKNPVTSAGSSPKIKNPKPSKPPAQKSKSCRVILPLKGGGGTNHSGTKVENKNLWNSSGRHEVLRDLPPNAAVYNGLSAPPSTVTFSHRDPSSALLNLKPLSFSSLFPGKTPPRSGQGMFQEKDGSGAKSLVAENCVSTQNNSHQMMKFKLVPPGQNGGKTSKVGFGIPNVMENLPNHSHKYQSKHPFLSQNTTKFARSIKFLEEKEDHGSFCETKEYQYSPNEISVQISLLDDTRNGSLEDSMEEVSDLSDTFSESSETDLPDSPTNIFPSIDQLFKRSFSYELDEMARSSNGDHLMELDDIQQILKEAENFDVYM